MILPLIKQINFSAVDSLNIGLNVYDTKQVWGYVHGIPTFILFYHYGSTYPQHYKILQIYGDKILERTGWIKTPFDLPADALLNNNRLLLVQRDVRVLAVGGFNIDPLTGLITGVSFVMWNAPYCGSGGGYTIVGFLAPFITQVPNSPIIIRNTYSGSVSGGDDISWMSTELIHNDNYDFGVNSFYNGVGPSGPYYGPLYKNNLIYATPNFTIWGSLPPTQIGGAYIMGRGNQSSDSNFPSDFNIFLFTQDSHGLAGPQCDLNTAAQSIRKIERVTVQELTDKPLGNHEAICPVTSDQANHFYFLTGTTPVLACIGSLPGPVIRRYEINTLPNVWENKSLLFLDKNGYLYVLGQKYNSDYKTLYLNKSVDKITQTINIAQLKIPENPVPVYGLDTRRFYSEN